MGGERITGSVQQLARCEVVSRANELVALQRSAYAIEAEIIGDSRIPQLTEEPAALIAAGLTWRVLTHEGHIVAAIAFTLVAGEIDIERLVVHPAWHRNGFARVLVASLPLLPTVVSTGRNNQPARELYGGLGFQHVDDTEIVPGLWISNYRRA